MQNAPGRPGIAPRWTSSDKVGVGTALSPLSRVWFTLSHGILNEVYYPRVDQACIRDLGLLVSDGHGFFSEEKRHCHHEVTTFEDGVPAYRLVNTCLRGRYRITKRIVADPRRDVVLMAIRLETLAGGPLRPVRVARPAPGEWRRTQHGLGWRLQGNADAPRRGGRHRAGAGRVGAVGGAFRRVRRRERRLGGDQPQL